MTQSKQALSGLTGAALILCALLATVSPILAQGAFYVEVPKDGRIHVFNIMKSYDEWSRTGELGKSITRIGAGPNGETLVFDSEEAIHMYNFRHNLPGELLLKPEEKKPVMKFGWKDGKTTFESDRAVLNISNRMQMRYTHELPGDPNINTAESRGSFRLRRARTKFDGWFYNKEFTYELQIDWSDSASIIQDLNVNYDLTHGKKLLQLKGGQFKVPFGRQELTSSGNQQFVDRSIVSAEFAKGRDTGFQAWGQTPRGTIEWRAGLFNGAGRNRTVNDNDKFQWNARVLWQPFGDLKYSESDFESTGTRPLLALGANYESNNLQGATSGVDIDREVFAGDLSMKWRGFSLMAEYFHRVSEPEGVVPAANAADFDSAGWHAQLGYFVYKRQFEVAVRYATIDPRDNTLTSGGALTTTIANDHMYERGVALNWFMNKHNLKLQADYRQVEDERRDITNDEARLQMQFIF